MNKLEQLKKLKKIDEIESSLDDKANRYETQSIQQQINNLVLGAVGDGNNAEIVQARGKFNVLNERFEYNDKSKASNFIVKNLIKNSQLLDITNWETTYASASFSNNTAIMLGTRNLAQLKQKLINLVNGHKYYISSELKATTNQAKLQCYIVTTGATLCEISHSGSGTFEKKSTIFTATQDIQFGFRVIDYRATGNDEIHLKNPLVVDLTDLFGVGKEPNISEFESYLNKSFSSFFYDEGVSKYILGELLNPPKQDIDTGFLPLFVNVNDSILNVISKYNLNKDIRFTLAKKGVNQIFDFNEICLITNITNTVSNDITIGERLTGNSTDWFSPYNIQAINNIDGDVPTNSHFTGGNHGYNNSGTILPENTPTGRTVSIKILVDGREQVNFSGYCSFIDVYWVNRVQANNTKKANGLGREVLEERYHAHFDGYKWSIDNEIEMLEATDWTTYYTLQFSNSYYTDGVYYHSSPNLKWNSYSLTHESGNKDCNAVTMKKGNDYVEIGVDNNFGLGVRKYSASTYDTKSCFYSTSKKSYFSVVSGHNYFEQGDVFSFKGYYRFYSR